MKYFAITPDGLAPAQLIGLLPALRKHSVGHLYLRAQSLHAECGQLIPLIRQHAIVPIIPCGLYQSAYASACGVHTRSDELFNACLNPGVVQTAACHSPGGACALFDKGADYVFISPVYRPFSKPEDNRPLIATSDLRMLARRFGPRIVLLGGLTPERIKDLRTMLGADCSVAGISMFFNTGAVHA